MTALYYDENLNEGSYIEISSETDEVLVVETGHTNVGKMFRFIISEKALRSVLDRHSLRRFKIKVYKVLWDGKGDNNGYIYGVEWYDGNDNFIDVMWFPELHKRDQFYETLKNKDRLWECKDE